MNMTTRSYGQKYMITKSRICLLTGFLLALLLPLPKGFAADSPFEIDIRELEKSPAKTAPAPKSVTGQGKTARRPSTSYQKYSVRRGDTIFIILTRRFGLSDKRAENLIPEILQINDISRDTVLKIGRTLLFPAKLKIVPVPAKSQPVEPAAPLQATAAPTADVPETAATPAVINTTVPDDIVALWVKLFPGTGQTGTAAGVADDWSDTHSIPWLPTADGARIVIVPAGTSPAVAEQHAAKVKGTRIVIEDADRKRFLSALLKAAGFERVEENGAVTIGDDPKLTFFTDFKLVRNIRDSEKPEIILLSDVTGKEACLPEQLIGILSGNGFRLVESCKSGSVPAPVTRIELASITTRNQEEIVDSLLKALEVTASKSRQVVLPSARKGSTMLGITADRYFEKSGRRFIVQFSNKNHYEDGLLSLFESERYQAIRIGKNDDFRTIAGKLLERINLNHGYDKYRFRSAENGRYSVELSGFLIESNDDAVKRLCLTALPVDGPTTRLLAGMRWELQ
jgi:hypothetical protein